jgi:hypothetical protein
MLSLFGSVQWIVFVVVFRIFIVIGDQVAPTEGRTSDRTSAGVLSSV